MKKLSMILVAVFISACGAEETAQKATPQCPADCGGALAGNPDFRCDLYNSSAYQSGIVSCGYDAATNSCMVDISQCVEVPAAAVFQACSGTGQGTCEPGLECAAVGPSQSVCMIPCTDDSVCTDVGGVAGACVATSQTGGHCFKKTAQLNTECGMTNFAICAEGQGQCSATKINLISDPNGGWADQEMVDMRCKPICDPTGTDPNAFTCGGGDSCLQAPTGTIMGIESQSNPGTGADTSSTADFRTCDKEAAGDTTQCSAGYECVSLQLSGGNSGDFCTLFEHWCGESAVFCDAYDRVGMTNCAQQNPCNMAPAYDMCSIMGATDTPANASCWGNLQVDGNDIFPICIASCEDEEIKNAAGDDLKLLDCGTGYSCKDTAPGKNLGFVHQSAIDTAFAADATCTADTECNTAKGFACVSSGEGQPKSCNRPAKTCLAD